MKVDRRTGQDLIRLAMRERRAPGKYDLFVWRDERDLHSIAVAWKSFTRRAIDLDDITAPDGEVMPSNAGPLPNGIERHRACYVGSFRVEKESD